MKKLLFLCLVLIPVLLNAQTNRFDSLFQEADYIFWAETYLDNLQVYHKGNPNFPNLWKYGTPYCLAAFDLSDTSHIMIRQVNGLKFIQAAQDIYGRNIYAVQSSDSLQPINYGNGLTFYNHRYLEFIYTWQRHQKKVTIGAGTRIYIILLINPFEKQI